MNAWATLRRDHRVTVMGDTVGNWKRLAYGYRFTCACGARLENSYQQYLRTQIIRHLDSSLHMEVPS